MGRKGKVRTLEDELNALLDSLCENPGMCLHPAKRQPLVTRESITDREFAFEVLRLEGFPNPEYEKKWLRLLSQPFREYFGADAVSARE